MFGKNRLKAIWTGLAAALMLACGALAACGYTPSQSGAQTGQGSDSAQFGQSDGQTGQSSSSQRPAAPIDVVALAPFEYVTKDDECVIIGVKDPAMTDIVVPDCVTDIVFGAFSKCPFVSSLTLPVAERNLGDYFGGVDFIPESLTTVVLSDYVTSIGVNAFRDCSSLTSVEIPDSVTSIGNSAFSGCSSLTSVEIPDSVTSIEYGAFQYCYSLTSVTIGKGVTSIGLGAFQYCYSLTSAIFENPNGWSVGGTSDLSDPATAARYLTSVYSNFYWSRN